MKWNKTVGVVLFLAFVGGFISTAWADDDSAALFGGSASDFIKSRTYIGVMGTSSTIDQGLDFNGTHFLQFGPVTFQTSPVTEVSNPEVDLVPAINRNFGFGVLLGHREGPWAAEVSYWRSDHTATWTGGGSVTFTTPATLQSFDCNFKRYFFTELPTQLFFNIGICFPWLWVSQGSNILNYQSGPSNTVVDINDETISGVGLDLGAGLEIYVGDGLSLVGGICQRWTGFNQINGASKIGENKMYFDGNPSDVGSLAGDGLNFYVGTTFGY